MLCFEGTTATSMHVTYLQDICLGFGPQHRPNGKGLDLIMLGNIVPLFLSLGLSYSTCVLLHNMHICPTLVVQVSSFILFAHLASSKDCIKVPSKDNIKFTITRIET